MDDTVRRHRRAALIARTRARAADLIATLPHPELHSHVRRAEQHLSEAVAWLEIYDRESRSSHLAHAEFRIAAAVAELHHVENAMATYGQPTEAAVLEG